LKNVTKTDVRVQKPDPTLTLNGVIKIMAAKSAADREKIIRDYKFPEPEGKAQGTYYQPARDLIRRYHDAANDPGVVQSGLRSLEAARDGASTAKLAKLDHNIRAIRAYNGQFSNRRFEPLIHRPVTVVVEGVSLSLRPDMLAKEKRSIRALRYAFGKDGADVAEVRVSLNLLHFYARAAGIPVSNPDCQLLIVADGTCKQCTGMMSAFEARLRAAMREVNALWPLILPTP
jgi:hypothetical protein